MTEKMDMAHRARQAVENMRRVDSESIARTAELGSQLNFQEAASEIGCIVDICKRLSPTNINFLPHAILARVPGCLKEILTIAERIGKFSTHLDYGNSHAHVRSAYIAQVREACENAFNILAPCLYSGVGQEGDFKRLQDTLVARTGELQRGLETSAKEADELLAQIRKTAAEQGVSQQAIFFKQEADKHAANAADWQKRVWQVASVLFAFAVVSIFLPVIPGMGAVDPWQLTLSKTLVFVVLGYALFFCANNYAAHRHNAVVNRHRQNALMTYEALVKANKNPENADIVLTHAARFIYAPQDSGYARGGNSDSGGISIESFRRIAGKAGEE